MIETMREPDQKIVYKTVGDVRLAMDVFVPDSHESSDKKPCIVFFHGGGWRGGTPSQFYPHCCHLSSLGVVAMSAEYRLMDVHGTTPYECVTDGKSAIRWVRQNAETLGIDPDMVAAGGGSAGGHVAAAAGSCSMFDEPDEDASLSSRPEAVVLFNPVFDNGPDGFGHECLGDQWREISPMHNVSSDTPPTIMFFGTNDTLVPVPTAEAYRNALKAAGVKCKLLLYEGQEHAFFNYRGGENACYYLTVAEMDKFLESLGYL